MATFEGKASSNAPGTFVLVHGAWHGGWCWRRVADRLNAHGHTVFTPTLTGLADRSHLLSPAVGLQTHITDVVNLIKWERLENIVLCGHSYGGMVISGVAEAVAPAIASIVYLDAFVPENGDSMRSITGPATIAAFDAAVARGESSVPPRSAEAFRVNEKDRAWVDALCTPQPMGAMTQTITLTGAHDGIKKKSYIRAAAYDNPAFDKYHAKLRAEPGWRVYELACGHDVMVDMPDRLVDILEEVA